MTRRVHAMWLALLLAVGLAVPAAAQEPAEQSDWIVTLVPGLEPGAVADAMSRGVGGTLGFVYDEVLGGFSFRGSSQAAAALSRNPFVSSVTADGLFTLQDLAGQGIFRIDANDAHNLDGGAYRGAGIRIAVIDSGIDLDHPDLVPNLDTPSGINCVGPGPPDDDHSHGTHVAGIAAAAYGPDGFGIAGVAPEATLIPVKSFDATGNATTAQVLCGINHVASLAGGSPLIANMSFGETGGDSACDDADTSDVLHEAVCDLVDAGVVPVAAAGNSATATATFIPAAFDEVITVSALTDFDGDPGALGGCDVDISFGYDCDDTFAAYSNYGPEVDVIAPGSRIYSTMPGGTHDTKSGTSMAAPHVSGVVAAMLSANANLTTDQLRFLLQDSGECPNPAGAVNTGGATCDGQGAWPDDPDGITEPLVNALRAAQAVVDLGPGPADFPPTASFDFACEDLTCTFTDTSTDFEGPIATWNWNFGDGVTSTEQSPQHTYGAEGTYTISLTVTDSAGQSDASSADAQAPPPYSPSVQGDWVGVYGADGHVLAAWDGSSDLVDVWFGSVTLDQGARYVWSSPSGDVRALEAPDESERRAAGYYDASQVRVTLDLTTDYVGELHLYAIDWDTTERRQTVTVDDGSGPQSVVIEAAFDQGAWMHFPIDVAAGGSVVITADRTGGANAVLSGIFLGEDVPQNPPPPPPPPPPPVPSAPQGDWVGVYGADGHVLAAWDRRTDLVDMPLATVTLDQGRRHRWSSSTGDVRALEAPDESERRAAGYFDKNQIRVSLTFSAGYVGELHLYAIDWDTTERRQTVTVDDGSGPQVFTIEAAFDQGAWMHFPIDVAAGGSVVITVDKTGGANAVLSGIFLGNA